MSLDSYYGAIESLEDPSNDASYFVLGFIEGAETLAYTFETGDIHDLVNRMEFILEELYDIEDVIDNESPDEESL